MSEFSTLIFGALLGLSLAAPPGPMNALIAAASVRSSWSGSVTGLGALSADAILGAIVFALQSAADLGRFVGYIYILGAAVMVVLALLLLRAKSTSEPAASRHLSTYSRALVLGITNPFQVVWWITAGVAFAYVGGLLLFIGLFAAITAWIIAFPRLVHTGARRYPQIGRWISLGSAALLLGFSAYFVALAVLTFA